MSENLRSQIKVFNLEQLGINAIKFIAEIKDSFLELPTDPYDTRLAQIQFLKQELPHQIEKLEQIFEDYYTGKLSEPALQPFLTEISTEKLEIFKRIQPFRRRGIAQFHLSASNGMQLEEQKVVPFCQRTTSYLNLPRHFQHLDSKMTHCPDYQKLIKGVAGLVKEQRDFNEMIISLHHMHSFATPNTVRVSNTPEGIHQDGADFIASAIVVERYNVGGGVSKIYREDKQTLLLETCLSPGEGICQPDEGSQLWHEVTPIYRADETLPLGYRSIIGLDMYLN